jgi:diguanylate cyclase (GGDEF)-like protein
MADREAGADERSFASVDRETALTDRGAGASERTHAGRDRATASEDREESAHERESASIDGLTGVFNRGAGLEILHRDIARAKRTGDPLVLAFLDVDHLKTVNDAGGHAAGDRMLTEVAQTVKAALRPYDLIIRYGGDEFICAIAGLDMPEVTKRFALVDSALAQAQQRGSITAGIASLQPDDSAGDLIARADQALYLKRQHEGSGEASTQ